MSYYLLLFTWVGIGGFAYCLLEKNYKSTKILVQTIEKQKRYHHCGRKKAFNQNLLEAVHYLKKLSPKDEEWMNENYEKWVVDENLNCEDLKESILLRKQNDKKKDVVWPNWVFVIVKRDE